MLEVSAELAMTLGGKPLTFFADYGKNDRRKRFGTTPDGLDTAYGARLPVRTRHGARTWEVGYIYQKTEKDALFGSGSTPTSRAALTGRRRRVFRFGYGFGRNFRINATYFLNDRTSTCRRPSAGSVTIEYKRLQLDLNMSF